MAKTDHFYDEVIWSSLKNLEKSSRLSRNIFDICRKLTTLLNARVISIFSLVIMLLFFLELVFILSEIWNSSLTNDVVRGL